MSAPYEDIALAASRARAAATLTRSGRDLNRCSADLRQKLTRCAVALSDEATQLEALLAQARLEAAERRRA